MEDNHDFEEMFSEIRKQLYKDDFFALMLIDNVEKYLELLREQLKEADDMDLLSYHLQEAMSAYSRWETEQSLDELSSKGLIQMVVDENGELAYQATDKGLEVNDLIRASLEDAVKITSNDESPIVPDLGDIKYSTDIFRVHQVDGGLRFFDHGDNFEIIVIPAGRQHDGNKMVQWFHTIFQDYHDVGPNGRYELVDENGLYNKLNNTYI